MSRGEKRLVIIDGKSVFYRGYYAMGALSTSDGTPTGGVYGFAAIAMELVKQLQPTKVVVAWDSKTSTAKRKALYEEYKAGRVKPPDDFYAQIPYLKDLVLALGWSFVECDAFEADDIIGTLACQAEKEGDYETYIISSDLDMLQIVDEHTKMYRILKGFSKLEEIDVPALEQKYGVKKPQFLDLKALKGDSSDNIPGVPGIGEKTAAKLLSQYDSLDGIYQHLDEISGATKTKLERGEQSARMSYTLAKIMFDAPVVLDDLPDLVVDREKIIDALKKLEFKSLITKFDRTLKRMSGDVDESSEKDLPKQRQVGLNLPEVAVEVVDDGKAVSGGVIVSWDIKKLMHERTEIAEKILAGAEFWDLGQGAFLLNPLAREVERGNEQEIYFEQKLALEQSPELDNIFVHFDEPLIPVLYKMEKVGMLIDRKHFDSLRKEFSAEVADLEEEICGIAGQKFNINSPMQLSKVLFEDLGLPTTGVKKTAKGYSTGAKELERLKNKHPVIAKIKEYREASKLLSTYITPLPELADNDDRIHTTFTQNVTATGRLSSVNPNLQNIPVRTEVGKRIREGFVADKGNVLVSADYSQFELRLAAALANDQKLIDDFNNDVDIHRKTASEAFGVPIEEVTKQQRRAAKVVNFGILYGMSVRGLAEAAKMNYDEAKKFIDNYFELRKPIKEYLEKTLEKARQEGYVATYFGRRRPTPDVKSSNFIVRTSAERAAQNMPIQGTEADLMKKAMISVDKLLPKDARLVMQVHDSMIVECSELVKDEVGRILQETMEGVAPELGVKLKVDVTVGDNWGEL